jgi:hypothetical protein
MLVHRQHVHAHVQLDIVVQFVKQHLVHQRHVSTLVRVLLMDQDMSALVLQVILVRIVRLHLVAALRVLTVVLVRIKQMEPMYAHAQQVIPERIARSHHVQVLLA